MTAPYGITKRQGECLDFIRDRIAATGRPPSYLEIRAGLGVKSNNCVHRLVKALERRGHIRRLPGEGRSITLVERPDRAMADEDARRVNACVVACSGIPTDELVRLGLGGLRRAFDAYRRDLRAASTPALLEVQDA